MRSIFGWSLPPGCSQHDIDSAFGNEEPCQHCGKDSDDCECAECPTCGDYGCLTHTTPQDLYATKARFEHVVRAINTELKRRGLPEYEQEEPFDEITEAEKEQ